MEELAAIHRNGNTILMVTHNPDLTTYATRVIHMLDGQIDKDTKDINVKKKATASEKRPLGEKLKVTKKPRKSRKRARK